MGTDINSKPPEPTAFERLAVELARSAGERIVLVLRAVDFERIAWREGRTRARESERTALAAFADVAQTTLRTRDAIAHEEGSDLFLAALLGAEPPADIPGTARTVIEQLARRFSKTTGLTVEAGWTLYERGASPIDALRATVTTAQERGARERERYGFFAKLGHEMRTPLSSIDGFLSALLDYDLDTTSRRHFTETAQLETLRLRRLVDGMYALSLIDLDSDLPCDAMCDAALAIERACDAIFPTASRRGTKLQVCSRVEFAIPLGAEHAVGLFVGILENAIKHGRERGRIDIRLQDIGSGLEICFDDDGPGVAPEEREHIFEPLVRGRQTAASGHGLGLSIVRTLIERVGGDVRVARSPLGGARFAVWLPAANRARALSLDLREFHTPITMRPP